MDTKTNDDKVDISRSGRVRKKSSKLIDFQSPDEVEKKLKRLTKTNENKRTREQGANRVGRPSNRSRTRTASNISSNFNDVFDSMEDDNEPDDEEEQEQEEEEEDEEEDDDENYIDDDYDELDEMVADIVEGVEAESSFDQENSFNESKVRSSLYMSEKSNKRKVLRDGKIVTSKVERKDKGKVRYTAYSLWAREFRNTSKFSKNQDLDFSNASRRLSELWANVSNKEKSAWRRKAKIQATKAKARERSTLSRSPEITTSPSSFANRATTSRTRKLAAMESQKTPPSSSPPSTSKRKRYNSQRSCTLTSASISNAAANDSLSRITNGIGTDFLNSSYLSSTNSPTLSSSHKAHQLPNIEPIDAAAHLKLLGESLSIIGERLKEHEGQIALSGSLSVLLDSILCSLGPLMCLTSFIPGLEKKPHLNANLASTLDNIAYVMPGL